MMDFWSSAAGMVGVELTSADLAGALQSANENNITIFHVTYLSELTARFDISRKDLGVLSRSLELRGDSVRVYKRRGLFWTFKKLLERPVLVAGMAILLLLVLMLPGKVLFIRVEGNSQVSSRQILDAAEECGIRFWASRREVRSEKMKNALLSAVPQLQWAGVNTYGCTAVISVRERSDYAQSKEENGVCSIVASRDGIVESVTVTRGNALCTVGQAVTEGQVLVSGYTDCGILIQATRAEGEIYGITSRDLQVVTPCDYTQREAITEIRHKYSLLIGKKRINLWKDSGISDVSCGRMYEEYYITLPGGFRLPVALAVETYAFYETADGESEWEAACEALSGFAEGYLSRQMIAGQILRKDQEVTRENGICRLAGTYLCRELIGRVQQEQIGE